MSQEWNSLVADVTASGFPFGYFLDELQPDARNYLSRQQAFVLADGIVSADELRRFHEAAARLNVPADFVRPMVAGLERAFRISEVRAGRLQQVQASDVHLATDEFCYFVGGGVRTDSCGQARFLIRDESSLRARALCSRLRAKADSFRGQRSIASLRVSGDD